MTSKKKDKINICDKWLNLNYLDQFKSNIQMIKFKLFGLI